jgi:hypothetical protein
MRISELASVGTTTDEETIEWIADFEARVAGGEDNPTRIVHLDDPPELYQVLKDGDALFRGDDDRLYLRVLPFLTHVRGPRWLAQKVSRAELEHRLDALGFSKPPTDDRGRLSARRPSTIEHGPATRDRTFLRSKPGFTAR